MTETRSGNEASKHSSQPDALLTTDEDPLPGLIRSLREKKRRESEQKEKKPPVSESKE